MIGLSLNGFVLKADVIKVISNKSNLLHLSLALSFCTGGLPSLTFLRNLKHLILNSSQHVNDSTLKEISECCRDLKCLYLSDCDRITDEGVRYLADLPHLEELVLTAISRITGNRLWTLSNLKRINCAGCTNIRDDAIIKIMQNAVNLEHVSVVQSGITIRTLEAANSISKERNRSLEVLVSPAVKNAWHETDVCISVIVLHFIW